MICKILALLVYTLTAENKCSLLNRDNLTQPTHLELSQKEKTFSELFSAFFKSRLSFEYFQKKGDPHS